MSYLTVNQAIEPSLTVLLTMPVYCANGFPSFQQAKSFPISSAWDPLNFQESDLCSGIEP